MAWVWHYTPEFGFARAEIDYLACEPMTGADALSETPLGANLPRPIFRARAKLARFLKYHCPPIGEHPVVDRAWQEIILRFVPAGRVQFFPVRLIAKDGENDDYSWVIPFDRVRCIDVKRSKITAKVEKPDITLIFRADEYVHKGGCLGNGHLARDEQQPSHMVLSDRLRDALAATGESSMFYQPEDVPTLFGRNSVVPAWRTR